MSKLDIAAIKTQKIGNTGKRVLLVEGITDKDIFTIFLNQKFPLWEQSWIIEVAGNKKRVLEGIKAEATWLGVVDKDEWNIETVIQRLIGSPNLVVLPRFCIESYFIDATELWEAFPEKQRLKISGGLAQLKNEFEVNKAKWLRHAALWHVINPLWAELRALGFKDGVLKTSNIPDDVALEAKLVEWHDAIDAQIILGKINQKISELAMIADFEFNTQWLYSKDFYPNVVHVILDQFLGQMDLKERRTAIARHLPVPHDLDSLWHKMGLIS